MKRTWLAFVLSLSLVVILGCSAYSSLTTEQKTEIAIRIMEGLGPIIKGAVLTGPAGVWHTGPVPKRISDDRKSLVVPNVYDARCWAEAEDVQRATGVSLPAYNPNCEVESESASLRTSTQDRIRAFSESVKESVRCEDRPDRRLSAVALGVTVQEVCGQVSSSAATLSGPIGVGLRPPLNTPFSWGSLRDGTITMIVRSWTRDGWVDAIKDDNGVQREGRTCCEMRGTIKGEANALYAAGYSNLWNAKPGNGDATSIETSLAGGWSSWGVAAQRSGQHLFHGWWMKYLGPSVPERAVAWPVAGEKCGLQLIHHESYNEWWYANNNHPNCVAEVGPVTPPQGDCPINWTGQGIPAGWSLDTCTKGPRANGKCCYNLAGGGAFSPERTCSLSLECFSTTPPTDGGSGEDGKPQNDACEIALGDLMTATAAVVRECRP